MISVPPENAQLLETALLESARFVRFLVAEGDKGNVAAVDELYRLFERGEARGAQNRGKKGKRMATAPIEEFDRFGDPAAKKEDEWAVASLWGSAAMPLLIPTRLLAFCEIAVVAVFAGQPSAPPCLCIAGREKGARRWLYSARICTDEAEAAAFVALALASGLLPASGAIGLSGSEVIAYADTFEGVGVHPEQMASVGQGARLSSSVWGLEYKIRNGELVHDGSAALAAAVQEATIERRGASLLIKDCAPILTVTLMATALLERQPILRPSEDDRASPPPRPASA